jgi:flagellar basal body-associated protein FliL
MKTNETIILITVVIGVAAAGGITVYWYVNQQQIQAQEDVNHLQILAQVVVSHREQCVTLTEAFKQRALDARDNFQSFEDWKNAFQPEAQSLSAQCS